MGKYCLPSHAIIYLFSSTFGILAYTFCLYLTNTCMLTSGFCSLFRFLYFFQISRIGIISSKGGVSDLGDVEHFPRMDNSMPLIAPLWTDIRSVTTLYRVTNDSDTLQLVRDMVVSRNPALSDYQPSVALVVTMEEVEIEFHQRLDVRTQCGTCDENFK